MATGRNRPSAITEGETADILALLRQGIERSERDAVARVGLSWVAWERRKDRSSIRGDNPNLRELLRDALAQMATTQAPREPVPPLEEFRLRCIGHDTPAHHREWTEAVLAHDNVMILCPPEHAKTSFAEEYAVWRIVSDPNVRGIYVSQTQDAAKERLFRIGELLTNEEYYDANDLVNVVRKWGPFKTRTTEWQQTKFYVHGRTSGERSPTMQALGVGNQIQGARADFIVLDDIADLRKQSEQEKRRMWRWIGQEVVTRLSGADAKLIIIATRVDELDIYQRLLTTEIDLSVSFHFIVQQAITDEEKKLTLWPERWPYEALAAKRDNPLMDERTWALVYQQQSTGSPEAPFSEEVIDRAKTTDYSLGTRTPGLHTVMGVDPALTGTMACVVLGIDHSTGVRYVLDVVAEPNLQDPARVKDLVVDLAAKYGCREVRVEKNAMQGFFSRDFGPGGLGLRLHAVGAMLVEEFSSHHNKYDRERGVVSVASQMAAGLYRIPWDQQSAVRLRPFIDELMSWRPVGTRHLRQDQVMALWLAELSAVAHLNTSNIPAPDREVPSYVPKAVQVPAWVRTKAARARRSA